MCSWRSWRARDGASHTLSQPSYKTPRACSTGIIQFQATYQQRKATQRKMTEKSRIQKRIAKMVDFLTRRRPRDSDKRKSSVKGVQRRRSMPARERNAINQSAIWRQNIAELCEEYDVHAEAKYATLSYRKNDRIERVAPLDLTCTLGKIHFQKELFQEDVEDLRQEAFYLRQTRDRLFAENASIKFRRSVGSRLDNLVY